jgi:hypothetical protein
VRHRISITLTAALLCAAAMSSASTAASPVRSCGDLPATATHNDIYNVTARGLSCAQARRATITLFHNCSGAPCSAIGLRFACTNLAGGEQVDLRCVSGGRVVRFHTGV